MWLWGANLKSDASGILNCIELFSLETAIVFNRQKEGKITDIFQIN